MTELTVPGRPPTNNPLLVLAEKCDGIIEQLKLMNEGAHTYALQPTDEQGQTWLVYCVACSQKQERFVHPCESKGEHHIPPSTFALAPPPQV